MQLGDVYLSARRGEEAVMTSLECASILRDVLGPQHDYYARALHRVACSYFVQGDAATADSLFAESRRLLLSALGPESLDLANCIADHARTAIALNRLAEAEADLRNALQVQSNTLPPNHWLLARTRILLAECLDRRGQTDEAGALVSNAVAAFGAAPFAQRRECLRYAIGLYEHWGDPRVNGLREQLAGL
jgi:tetratricopeptide (TPR) repeat protein